MPIIKNMEIVESVLDEVTIPRFVKVRQNFDKTSLSDVTGAVRRELDKQQIKATVEAGDKVAICVGSRGIANLAQIVKEVVSKIKEQGAAPIIIPAMGSHGTATAAGQKAILADYGITEEATGAEIVSCMDVVQVGTITDGTPVYADKNLTTVDRIIIINRVKPHPSFSGPIESGLVKMSVIGLGKQKGAETCHQLSFKNFAPRLLEMSRAILKSLPVIYGLAIVENAYDQTLEVNAIPADKFESIEPILLEKAKAHMPRIMFNSLDVLVIDEIGKNVSGSGADPNVTGKFSSEFKHAEFDPARRMVIRNLTKETEGSAVGMGIADFVTQRLYDKFDFAKTYINCITSTLTIGGRLPMVMRNDYYAIKAAIKTCNILQLNKVRIAWIKNTMELEKMLISETLLEEAQNNLDITVLDEPFELKFNSSGYIIGHR